MNEEQLYVYAAEAVTAAEALRAFIASLKEASAVHGLLYSPSRCRLCVIESENGDSEKILVRDEFGRNVSLGDVFELRAFCPEAELRWMNTGSGSGQAVILRESQAVLNGPWNSRAESFLGKIPLKYMLWGTAPSENSDTASAPPLADGWTYLREGRIGGLPVPLAGMSPGQPGYLHAVEYLRESDEDGNVTVLDERLLQLSSDAEREPTKAGASE